jgi:hypothetical protein
MTTILQIKQIILTGVCLSFSPLALLFKNSLFLVFLRVIDASLIIYFSGYLMVFLHSFPSCNVWLAALSQRSCPQYLSLATHTV